MVKRVKMKKKYYAYIVGNNSGICTSWPECQKMVMGKSARYRSFPSEKEARLWLEDPSVAPAANKNSGKKSKKYYAYNLFEIGKAGIVTSWDECKNITAIGKARYKSFKTYEEAKEWLDMGGRYLSETEIRMGLPDGIYFDAGTGRGIGTEVRVTDKMGNSLLHKLLPQEKVNAHGNYLTKEGSTNNFGELLGLYCALKIAIEENILNIYGDSNLVISYWSKGLIKRESQKKETLDLAEKVVTLRRRYESIGGQIQHISGDINPADLGFHK